MFFMVFRFAPCISPTRWSASEVAFHPLSVFLGIACGPIRFAASMVVFRSVVVFLQFPAPIWDFLASPISIRIPPGFAIEIVLFSACCLPIVVYFAMCGFGGRFPMCACCGVLLICLLYCVGFSVLLPYALIRFLHSKASAFFRIVAHNFLKNDAF